MPKEDKTQEPEDKGQEEKEESKQQTEEEKDEIFTGAFRDATTKKDSTDDKGKGSEEEGEEKGGEGDKDKSGEEEKDEGDGSKGKGSAKEGAEKEGEGEEEGEAKKDIEARAQRLKKIMEGSKEKEEEEEEPKKKTTKKKASKKKAEKEEEEEEEAEPIISSIALTDAEKDFLEDMPEVSAILEKALKKAMRGVKGGGEEVPQEVVDVLEKQNSQIATLRTQVHLTKLVPEWESIVFEGNKTLETGERMPNEAFWTWLDEQPDLYKALASSDNPTDMAAVLKYYKEDNAKNKLAEKDKASEDKLKKRKDLHSHSANDSKTTKKEKKAISDDDYSGAFKEASKKAAKGQQ